MISNFFVEPFNIEPRPLEAPINPRPINQPIPTPITRPEPPTPQPDHAQEIVQSTLMPYTFVRPLPQEARQSESELLMQAIVIVARKEQTFVTQCALRDLVRKFAHQYSLDF